MSTVITFQLYILGERRKLLPKSHIGTLFDLLNTSGGEEMNELSKLQTEDERLSLDYSAYLQAKSTSILRCSALLLESGSRDTLDDK